MTNFCLACRYVGDVDDRNEIKTSDFDSTRLIRSSDDVGDYISQQVVWKPTREDLCGYDDLVSLHVLSKLDLFCTILIHLFYDDRKAIAGVKV